MIKNVIDRIVIFLVASLVLFVVVNVLNLIFTSIQLRFGYCLLGAIMATVMTLVSDIKNFKERKDI